MSAYYKVIRIVSADKMPNDMNIFERTPEQKAGALGSAVKMTARTLSSLSQVLNALINSPMMFLLMEFLLWIVTA